MTPRSHPGIPDSHRTSDPGARVLELQRRIEKLEAQDDELFGRFGVRDWVACILVALIVPTAVLLWFAR